MACPASGLNVEDCQKTYEDLSAKGVEFLQEPQERPYGVEALMRDNSGNWMVLVRAARLHARGLRGRRHVVSGHCGVTSGT